jgi:hypothetical protein
MLHSYKRSVQENNGINFTWICRSYDSDAIIIVFGYLEITRHRFIQYVLYKKGDRCTKKSILTLATTEYLVIIFSEHNRNEYRKH